MAQKELFCNDDDDDHHHHHHHGGGGGDKQTELHYFSGH
jgi:hypothetical protein